MKKVQLYIHTVRYLKIRQIGYRLWYAAKQRWPVRTDHHRQIRSVPILRPLVPGTFLVKPDSYSPPATFRFLNRTYTFEESINWDLQDFDKLWTYHLNYFDFLQQDGISKEDGLRLMYEFMQAESGSINETSEKRKEESGNLNAKEPYPTSLRLVNWLKFIYRHSITQKEILRFMLADLYTLDERIEYHLMANHLFENAVSLTIGGYCLQHKPIFDKGCMLLRDQLNEQFLDDGAHFEKSPMYHQILLERVLDIIHFLSESDPEKEHSPGEESDTKNSKEENTGQERLHEIPDPELINELCETARNMLSWLDTMTFSDGTVPCFNDATPGMAPSTRELAAYAHRLGIHAGKHSGKGFGKSPQHASGQDILSDSGYRKVMTERYELILDGGGICPDYQPGHSHNDAGSFVLYIDGMPAIVDTAISTYEENARRIYERSVVAHNTTHPSGIEPSEIWGSFRMGSRETVKMSTTDSRKFEISRTLPGRSHYRLTRNFECDDRRILITDHCHSNRSTVEYHARLHFAPDVTVKTTKEGVETPNFYVTLHGATEFQLEPCYIAAGFNRLRQSYKLSVTFIRALTTEIRVK